MIDNLRAFAAVVESHSLGVAAERLFITQSAVSRRIQQFEDSVGAPLFDRTQRPLGVTALGQRMYTQVLEILSAVDDLVAMPSEAAVPRGVLRLGLTPALGDSIPAEAVAHMKGAFPDLEVRIRTDQADGLRGALGAGELDAAFLVLPSVARLDEPLLGRRLSTLDVVIVQSRAQPLFVGPTPLRDLRRVDWVLNPMGCRYRAELEHAMHARGNALRVAVDVYGVDTQLRMVASGVGLGLVPRGVMQASPRRDDVAIVDVVDFSMQLDVWLASVGRLGNMRRAVDVIAEALAAQFGDTLRGDQAVAGVASTSAS
jgi:DNA-binding transcriptional LysR family regulator